MYLLSNRGAKSDKHHGQCREGKPRPVDKMCTRYVWREVERADIWCGRAQRQRLSPGIEYSRPLRLFRIVDEGLYNYTCSPLDYELLHYISPILLCKPAKLTNYVRHAVRAPPPMPIGMEQHVEGSWLHMRPCEIRVSNVVDGNGVYLLTSRQSRSARSTSDR